MHSFAQMNGHHQQVGPPSQAFQVAAPLAQNATRNYAWSSEDAFNYIAVKSGVQPSERGNVTSYNGDHSNSQVANWQNSEAPNQTVNSQNGAKPEKDHYIKMLLHYLDPEMTLQNENASLMAKKRQAAQLQTFHQTSANRTPQNTINTNTTYPQQNMSPCWNPSAAVNRIQTTDVQAGQVASHSQPNGVQQGLYPNTNGGLTRGVSAYTTAAASLRCEQVVNSSMLVPAAAHGGQAVQLAHNQAPRQNKTKQRFSPSYPVSHGITTCQSSGINSMTAQSQPSNTQTLFTPNMSQQTQNTVTHFPLNNWSNANSNNAHLMNQPVASYVGAANPPHPIVALQRMARSKETMDNQCMSYTAGSAGSRNPPPPYNMHHHTSMAGLSNQHMQIVNSVPSSGGFNTNASQSLRVHSGQSLPQSVVSRAQHTVNTQTVQTSLPNASSVTIVENGHGSGKSETARAYPPNINALSRGSPVESPRSASQRMNSTGRALTQKFMKQSFLAKHSQLVRVLGFSTQVQQDDGSAPSTSSHTGTKVIAVVQPLSPQHGVTSPNTTTCESESVQEKDCISPNVEKIKEVACTEEKSNHHTESQTQTSSIKAKPNDGAVLASSSESDSLDLSQTSGPDIEGAASTQNPSDVTPSESCPNKQNERTTPPSSTVPDLSSLQTTSWTAKALTELILDTEKAEKNSEAVSKHEESLKFPAMFSKTNCMTMLRYFIPGILYSFLSDVEKFCEFHIMENTVVLSEVKHNQLKLYHVLKDGEVYSEPPYKSLWLNVNDQLDDIDKDFGFPWVFKNRQYVLDTDSQVDQVKTTNNDPEPALPEVPNTVLTECESTDSIKKDQAPPGETPSTPLASLSDSKSDDLNDSSYSFKIHVLAPEEAKILYEQVQKNKHQIIDYQKLTETVVDKSAKVVSEKMDTALKESVGLIRSTSDQIDQICCLAKLMKMKSGLSRPSLKCQCKENQSHLENTAKTPFHDPDSPGKSQEDSCHIISLSSPGLCDDLCQIIDLTDDDDKLPSYSDPEPKTISEVSNNTEPKTISEISNDPEPDIIFEISSGSELETFSEISNGPELETFSEISNGPEPETISEISNDPEPETISEISNDPEPETISEINDPEPETISEINDPEPETISEISNDPEPETISEMSNDPEPETISEMSNDPEPETISEISNDPEPETISEISNGSQSDVGGSDEDDNLSNGDPILPNVMTNIAVEMIQSVDECAQDFKSAESVQLSASVIIAKETECIELSSTENKVSFQMSDQKEDSGEEQLQPADVAESSPQSKEVAQTDRKVTDQTPSSDHHKHGTLSTTRQRQSSLHNYFSSFTESKKCKLPLDLNLQNASNVRRSATEVKTVELALFGSVKHNKDAKSLFSPSCMFSYENTIPPPVLSVKLNPLRRNSVEAPSTQEYSAKELIYQRWRKSFPTTRLSIIRGRKHKWKITRSVSAPLPTMSLKRMKSSVPPDGNNKCRLRLKRSLSDRLSPEAVKKKRYSIVPYQPDDRERSNTENESQDAPSLQESIVLKFSVLPNTFSLLDGSTQRSETDEPPSDKPELAEEKDRISNKVVNRKVKQWYPSPQKQYRPLSAPRNTSLFSEYQKKYKDKK